MLNSGCGLLAILALTSTASFAQTSIESCSASPEDRQFHEELAKSPHPLELLREKLAAAPENLFFHRWLIENKQTERGSLADEYRKKLNEHPGSAFYLYLYGDSLIGANTPEATRQIDLAIAADPKLPWTYYSLLEIYSNGNAKDAGKLADNLLAFSDLCPAVLSTYHFIRFVEDREKLRELTARFRHAVDNDSSRTAAASYRPLWTAEFRAADPSAFDSLRAQVAKDILRVKELDPGNIEVLREGYKLTGDSAAANALPPPDKKSSPRTFRTDYEAWSKTHPYPKADASPQEKDNFDRELVEASAQWVKDWPDDPSARQWRLTSLAKLKSTPNEELEKAGDALLNTLKQHPFKGCMIMPFQATVAQIWGERDIRPEQCLQLADEALAEIDRSAKANPAFAKTREYAVLTGRFDTLTIEAEAARRVKNFEKAHAALDQIKRGLDGSSGDYTRARHSYLSQSALLAEAEGHKLDALTYDRLLFSQFPPHPDEEAHALALWKEMGGTDEGFKLWASLEQPKKPAVVEETTPWAETNKPLSALNAPDANSRTWTMADLKGKTTLITVWATWCAPCRAELPAVQKLFDQLADRKDVQVISISVDENPGVIAPFLKENHYTFPVIFARSTLIDELDGLGGIPRTWIVDSNGSLRFERLGYNPADWPQETMQKITRLSLHP